MTTLEERVSKLEGTYEQVDRRLALLTTSFDALRMEITTKFNVMIVVIATCGIGIAGAIATLALRV